MEQQEQAPPQPQLLAEPPKPDVLSADESNDSYLSSGTSSYESDDGRGKKEEIKELTLEMMQDEFEEPSMNSYSRFKT